MSGTPDFGTVDPRHYERIRELARVVADTMAKHLLPDRVADPPAGTAETRGA